MRRVVGRLVLLGVVLVLAAAAWTASRGWVAYSALQDVRDGVPAVVDAVTAVDPDALARASDDVREDARRARDATDDPLWRLASRFPLGGENLAALTTSSRAVDGLATDGLPALEQVVTGVDDARDALTGGEGLDVGALRSAFDALGELQQATTTARERLATIRGEHLLPQVEQARDELRSSLDLAGRAEDLLADIDVPGAGALSDLASGRPPSLEDLRDAAGDLVPDDVEDGLRDLGERLPDGVLPDGLLDEAFPTGSR
ncbi:hypothetical protein WDZ17_15860 [Pseudokineococcus basanitobsidens]|uniref:DUF4012 domain-containing protein n=1 Tax=Pseudokineococcus basanitobsidens TaxID=1926649 RepID=A0ABU8RPA3_9ACTN